MYHFYLLIFFLVAVSLAPIEGQRYETVEIRDNWRLYNDKKNINLTGVTIPSIVQNTLYRKGIISDPLKRFNDREIRWVAYEDWTYENVFQLDEKINIKNTLVNLELNYLDTIADVYLNDHLILESRNEFIKQTIPDINKYLNYTENRLRIEFKSPVLYAKNKSEEYKLRTPQECPPSEQHGECHVNFIRKQQFKFGWDWGPAIPSIGIKSMINLKFIFDFDYEYSISIYPERNDVPLNKLENWIGSFQLETYLNSYAYRKSNFVFVIRFDELNFNYTQNLTVAPSESQFKLMKFDIVIPNNRIRYWYPRGYGEQNFHKMYLEVRYYTGVYEIKDVAFRKVELIEEPVNPLNPEHGLSFYYKINDIPVFLKGSNYIPINMFNDEYFYRDIYRILQFAVDANMNMLRVWGGGTYEVDWFYDIADRLGILLLQNLMFGVTFYPTNKEFVDLSVKEIEHQVKRLRIHPSIIAWEGNNEIEWFLYEDWFDTNSEKSRFKQDHEELFVRRFPDEIRKLDSPLSRPYIRTTPSNSKNYDIENPNDARYGDIHFYDYTSNLWKYENFNISRFMSEFSVQSFPSFSTLSRSYTDYYVDMKFDSELNQYRNHRVNGNPDILLEIQNNLPLPVIKDEMEYFRSIIYLSQLNQAMTLKTGIELYRRNRNTLDENGIGNCMGVLYWQLNDVWAAPTWSTVDHENVLKMGHYTVRKAYSNILLSPYIDKKDNSLYVVLVNDNLQNVSDTLILNFYNSTMNFEPTEVKVFIPSVQPLSANKVYKESLDKIEALCGKSCLITVNLEKTRNDPNYKDNLLENFIFTNDNIFSLPNLSIPKIEVTNVVLLNSSSVQIDIATDSIALFVWLDFDRYNYYFIGSFSENGFHMLTQNKSVIFHYERDFEDDQFETLKKEIRVSSLMNKYKSDINSAIRHTTNNLFLMTILISFIFMLS